MHLYRLLDSRTPGNKRAARRSATALLAVSSAVLSLATPTTSRAWIHDSNLDHVDDRIAEVHHLGVQAAYEHRDVSARMRIAVFDEVSPREYGVYIGYHRRPTEADLAALVDLGLTTIHRYEFIDYVRARGTFGQLQSAVSLEGVSRVEAIPMVYAFNHWGARVLRARDSRGLGSSQDFVLFPSAEDLGIDGSGIVIGVLDTGVNDVVDDLNPAYPGHESLVGKFLGGGNFFFGNPLLNTAANQSENPRDHGSAASSYHATHVAGTAMGSGGETGFFAGMAPAARLVDCKVLSDAGVGFGSADGIEWCISNMDNTWGLTGADLVYAGIDVLNLSLGGLDPSDGTDAGSQMVNAAVNAGLVVCIATGNDGNVDHIASPAAADLSIAVGATNHYGTLDRSDDLVTDFSNEGTRTDDGDQDHFDEMKPNVSAPGAGTMSSEGDFTTQGESYKKLSGTSMATPHVAGIAALVRQANPNATALEIRDILQNTAEHGLGTVKAARPSDPFGLDPNYNPAGGYGTVDVYAAIKEATNSTSGVQVVQIRPLARPADVAVDVQWVTQREYANLGFNIYRAQDVGGAPGTYGKVNGPVPITPVGDSDIFADDNRTYYVFTDEDPALELGQTYWYEVRWVDPSGVEHAEPAAPVDLGEPSSLAVINYAVVHNAVDNDLTIRYGVSTVRDPNQPDWFALGDGTAGTDSIGVIEPANDVTATIGYLEHFWSEPIRANQGLDDYIPPSAEYPWFLNVQEGGYLNRFGRVTGFSMFVYTEPGQSSGYTIETQDPLPYPTIEGQSITLWLDMVPASSGTIRLSAESHSRGIRVLFETPEGVPLQAARFSRSDSPDPQSRSFLSEEAMPIDGGRLEFVDEDVDPERIYYYWAEHRGAGGRTILSGPVQASHRKLETHASFQGGNPIDARSTLRYVIADDVAGTGAVPVRAEVYDVRGRKVRQLVDERQTQGNYSVPWNGRDDQGRELAQGLYFFRFQAGGKSSRAKLTVVR